MQKQTTRNVTGRKARIAAIAALAGTAAALLAPSPPAQAGPATPRIIGGHDATGNRPWMALVQSRYEVEGETRFGECSGLLLAPAWVITAAHCLFKENSPEQLDPVANDLQVFIGDHPGGFQTAAVAAVHLPPNQTSSQSFRLGNDIALLKLQTPITVTAYPNLADAATLEALRALDSAGRDESLTALGWGKTSNDSNRIADTLQQVQLDAVPLPACRSAWAALGETLTDTMLCAAELNPVNGLQQDTCSGDSGGPLLTGSAAGPFVVGITSFGTPTCASGTPSVYTNLLTQVPFIENRSPLVDLRMAPDDATARHYSAPGPGHALTISARLGNDSLANTASGVAVQVTSDNARVSVSPSCPDGCTGHTLAPAGTLAVTATARALLADQQATLTLRGSADQSDYRPRNNHAAAVVIFSHRPDLAVRVLSASTLRHSDGRGEATVRVSVRNQSTVSAARASQAYLTLGLPVGTSLLGVTGDDGHATPDCNGNVCLIGTLAPRGAGLHARTLAIHLASGTPQPGTLALTVGNSGPEGEFPTDNNHARYTLAYPPVPPSPDSGGGGGALGGLILALLALFGAGRSLSARR